MAHPFEIAKDLEVEASPQQVWEAITTGPGQDSWFMGRSEIEPREGGAARWSIGDFTMESTVTAWDPPTHFVFRMDEAPDGAYHQFDYRIEPRDGVRAGIRYVHSGMLSGDWEAEYEAMSEGDPAYLHKLVEYLTYFPGRFATGVDAQGPQVADRERVMAAYRRGLGLGDTVVERDNERKLRDHAPMLTDDPARPPPNFRTRPPAGSGPRDPPDGMDLHPAVGSVWETRSSRATRSS